MTGCRMRSSWRSARPRPRTRSLLPNLPASKPAAPCRRRTHVADPLAPDQTSASGQGRDRRCMAASMSAMALATRAGETYGRTRSNATCANFIIWEEDANYSRPTSSSRRAQTSRRVKSSPPSRQRGRRKASTSLGRRRGGQSGRDLWDQDRLARPLPWRSEPHGERQWQASRLAGWRIQC